ncbi:hypothetical protein [Granulicoccus sp. GXG6511]|uniref:hypothetical protein n=1 Tax=Granulicoccus sp. GXG6511 TaxID=3381351 RepID=UPI003D7ED863
MSVDFGGLWPEEFGPEAGSKRELISRLEKALREGMPTLHDAAEEAGISASRIDAALTAAWDPCTHFTLPTSADTAEVVNFARRVNGWWWTDLVLLDPAWRASAFRATRSLALDYARSHFRRLPEDDQEAAVDDAIVLLCHRLLPLGELRGSTPAWASWNVVRRNVRWRLLDAADSFDAAGKGPDGKRVTSLNEHWDDAGDAGLTRLEQGVTTADGLGVEAVIWAAAAVALADSAPARLAGVRAGTSRAKLALTIAAAQRVLAMGCAGAEAPQATQDGRPIDRLTAEAVRQLFAEDALLVCFWGLRQAAPDTWGLYPGGRVPVRVDLVQVADAVSDHPDAGWFAMLSARRNELNRKGFLLHGVRDLVVNLIQDAAGVDEYVAS